MLRNITVLDLSHVFPGHFAGQMLGDLGAHIIKIEDPNHPDLLRKFTPRIAEESAFFLAVNRNKESLALDIKTSEGKEIFLQLAQKADVVLDNFRPGHMDNLGLGYDKLKLENPRLIYCNISGFGNNDAINSKRGAHDLNFIAESGILSATSAKDGSPVMPGISIAAFSGGFYAVIAILSALNQRTITNEGVSITSSIFDGLLQMASIATSKVDPSYTEQMPVNNYIYETSDGKYVALAAIEKKFWITFLKAIDRLGLINAHGTKVADTNTAFQELKSLFLSKTIQDWYEYLKDVDCCFSPVWNFTEALSSPYVEAKKLYIDLTHPSCGNLRQFPLPFVFSNDYKQQKKSPPLLGEQTEEILSSLGISQEKIAILTEKGIIKQ